MTQIVDLLGDQLAARANRLQRSLQTPARTTRNAVVVGRLLGTGFLVCFLTGLYSHLLQNPLPGMRFPTWPPDLYAITQGVHITVGIALIPLVLAKLWVVYPGLFAFPPFRGVVQLLERGSIALLVSTALLQLTIGLINTYQWYPWPFPFRAVHYALGWVLIGSVLLHVAVKLPTIARHWRRTAAANGSGAEPPAAGGS